MTKLSWFVLVGLLAVARLAADQAPAVARPYSEDWGDELVAAGNQREAFSQYHTVWSQWHVIESIEVKKYAQISSETEENLKRVTKKMADCLAQLDPPPAVPESAVFYAQKGVAYVKLAKDARDFTAAAELFGQALYAAPWVSDYHFNLALCRKSTGLLAPALMSLRFAALLTQDEKSLHDIRALQAEVEVMLEMKNRK